MFDFMLSRRRNRHWTATRTGPGWARANQKLSSMPCTVWTEVRRPPRTGRPGTPRSSTCWPRWASAWAWGTCGGSRTFATRMEEVSVSAEGIIRYVTLGLRPTTAVVLFKQGVDSVYFFHMDIFHPIFLPPFQGPSCCCMFFF